MEVTKLDRRREVGRRSEGNLRRHERGLHPPTSARIVGPVPDQPGPGKIAAVTTLIPNSTRCRTASKNLASRVQRPPRKSSCTVRCPSDCGDQ